MIGRRGRTDRTAPTMGCTVRVKKAATAMGNARAVEIPVRGLPTSAPIPRVMRPTVVTDRAHIHVRIGRSASANLKIPAGHIYRRGLSGNSVPGRILNARVSPPTTDGATRRNASANHVPTVLAWTVWNAGVICLAIGTTTRTICVGRIRRAARE